MMIAHHVERCIVRWGGTPNDYEAVNTFIDSSKLYLSDWRHRVLLHSTLGVMLVEELFPKLIPVRNKRNLIKYINTRTIAEQHIVEDLAFFGRKPTLYRQVSVGSSRGLQPQQVKGLIRTHEKKD
jgi:hypothetical protein